MPSGRFAARVLELLESVATQRADEPAVKAK
jgi:hypothetical protein